MALSAHMEPCGIIVDHFERYRNKFCDFHQQLSGSWFWILDLVLEQFLGLVLDQILDQDLVLDQGLVMDLSKSSVPSNRIQIRERGHIRI